MCGERWEEETMVGRMVVWDERDKINYQNGHCNKKT